MVQVSSLGSGTGWPRPVRSADAFVCEVDDRTLRWMATTPHGVVRPLLRGVGRAADLLLPFVAVTLRLAADGAEERRALARGWSAVVATALVQGVLLKPVIDRGRPDPERLPPAQRRRSSPTSSSFPSGHTGAAAAFATTVGLGVPRSRRRLALLACAVAYAQVYTGRHYVSDVVIGGSIGCAVGSLIDRRFDRRGRTTS